MILDALVDAVLDTAKLIPFLLITLHVSQIGFTEALTFMFLLPSCDSIE